MTSTRHELMCDSSPGTPETARAFPFAAMVGLQLAASHTAASAVQRLIPLPIASAASPIAPLSQNPHIARRTALTRLSNRRATAAR